MRGDVFLFFGIIVFIFIVWVAEGGPSHPISFAGPYITPLAGVGEHGTGYSLSSASSTTVQPTTQQVSQNLARAQSDVVSLEESLTESARFGTPSPYKGMITLSHSVGALGNTDPDQEYLSLYVSTRAPSTGINITDWRIEGEAEGHSILLPEGVNLPTSGNVNPTAPIVLLGGQTAIITIGDSPIGISFRENMCTGYLAQYQEFNPSIPRECPTPLNDFNRFFLGNEHSLDACKAYIETVPECTIPANEPTTGLSDDCFHFIDTYLNYNGCVVAHEGDRGFFGSTWRIYLGRTEQFFTYNHDSIKLLDANGLTVDMLSY